MRIMLLARYRNNTEAKLLVTFPETIMVESLVAVTGNILISIYTESLSMK